MLGNLSKILIRAPMFFNNEKKSLENIPEENNMDPFYQIKNIKNKEKNNNSIYFKEKDFWRKNIKLDMNFNHNKRLVPNLNISPIYNKINEYKQEKEKNNIIENNNVNRDINYYDKKIILSNTSMNNHRKTIKDKKNLNIYKKIFLLNKGNINDNNITLKTESNIMNNTNNLRNNLKNNKTLIINRYNTEELCISNIGKENGLKKKEIYKFPKDIKTFRSQESLFQDNIDQKLISLILVKPKIKEQLKSINRSMVGQRDYYVYQQSGRFHSPNPFYESMKRKEEMNKLMK